MSEHLFNITSHIIPTSHIRGFSRGIQDEQNGQLRLSLKHYVPRNREAQIGDPTLILAHGIGLSKESHEPFLDELLSRLPIRGAWACDAAHHGASYLLNEHIIGDEPHWLDSARDMLHMVNTFAAQMPPPIYGIGQSWGCSNSKSTFPSGFRLKLVSRVYVHLSRGPPLTLSALRRNADPEILKSS